MLVIIHLCYKNLPNAAKAQKKKFNHIIEKAFIFFALLS